MSLSNLFRRPLASRLVIAAPHGEVLIPLVADICVEVNPGEKRIRVAVPEGLLELNQKL